MMKIYLPHELQVRLISALKKAGRREIGGILMGEKLEDKGFRIIDMTIQTQKGTYAFFIRHLSAAIGALQDFFYRTRYDYTKFNYLGEWHSHPQFPLIPSNQDAETMKEIISDKDVGANFVILLLVKLVTDVDLAVAGIVFLPEYIYECDVIMEHKLG